MSSVPVGRRCTLLLFRHAAAINPAVLSAARASYTIYAYRAPKTVRSVALIGSDAVSPFGFRLPSRAFFWNKKSETTETAAGTPEKTLLVKEKIVEEEPAPTTPPLSEDVNSKSQRLGFSSAGDLLNRLVTSWPQIKTYSVWLGVSIGMLYVFKGGLGIVEYFATINFLDVGEVAFIAGLVSGVGLVICGWIGTRFLRLRPEPTFQQALKRINSDATVQKYMGEKIESGNFRAYSFINGTIRMTQEQRDKAAAQTGLYKYWQPRRLQLFFQASGSNGTVGMVSAEVEKNCQ